MKSKLKKKVAVMGLATILACYSNSADAQKPNLNPKVTAKTNISTNALIKLKTLQQEQVQNVDLGVTAKRIQAQDGYSDFFVEGSGDPWHEAFGDVIKGGKIRSVDKFSAARMDYVSDLKGRVTGVSQDGYSDFFVESGGGSWHEAFGDVVKGDKFTSNAINLRKDATLRAASLQKLNVMKSYSNMKARQ